MRTRRARGRPFLLQKYCQNLNGLKRHFRRIGELDPLISRPTGGLKGLSTD
jgi:hypothetical protein